MRKLLSANFARLWRSKLFWGGIIVMAALSVLLTWFNSEMSRNRGVWLDPYYFAYGPFVGIFCAAFAALFLGKEYSDGTVRNKLIAGCRRFEIYLANLITVFCATLMVMAAWLIGALAGIPVLGTWYIGAAGFMKYLLISVLFTASFSAIFTFIGMLYQKRSTNAVLSILLLLVFMIVSAFFYSMLTEPERFYLNDVDADTIGPGHLVGLEVDDNGVVFISSTQYVGGFNRQVYQFFMDFLPSGQAVSVFLIEPRSFPSPGGSYFGMLEPEHPVRMMIFSVIFTTLVTAAGLHAFNKKNIR